MRVQANASRFAVRAELHGIMSKPAAQRWRTVLGWSLRLIAAAILGQALFFKFSAAPESVFIFRTLGIEPWGRIFTGLCELLAVVLLLLPRTAGVGGALGAGLMAGALVSHLFVLGIEVQGDGGTLFGLAIITFVACTTTCFLQREQLLALLARRRYFRA